MFLSKKHLNSNIINQQIKKKMGIFSFIKTAGEKIFKSKKPEETHTEEERQVSSKEILDYIQVLGFKIDNLVVVVQGDKVTLRGEVPTQEEKEKIILAVGNIEGVGQVEETIAVVQPAPEAKLHTVKSGDTLSKIAKEYYGNANEYLKIFEANKPMLAHPDKIYVGQVLRIP